MSRPRPQGHAQAPVRAQRGREFGRHRAVLDADEAARVLSALAALPAPDDRDDRDDRDDLGAPGEPEVT